MSDIRDRLTKQVNQERELRGYSTSSPWSNALRPAISYLELAETATNPSEKFRNAWSALYNLWMMMHQRGEIENMTFTRFFTDVESSPSIRSIALSTPTPFLETLKKAQNALLFDAESKKPRDAKQLVELWLDQRKKGRELTPDKAVKYVFLIGRDLRNALSHPTLDPKSSNIRKALAFAADIFLPLAIAATEAIIERPPEGTTGRVVAYRSFLYPFLKNSDSPFSDYYLERLFPEQELSAFPEDESKAALKEINKELTTRRKDLVRADAEETLRGWCGPVLFQKLGIAPERGAKIVTDDGVFEPTAAIRKADAARLRKEYKGKDAGRDLACLIWVLPWSTSLDAVSDDEESSGKTVMEIAQSALTRADVDWAMLMNGQKLRLLSKTTAHKPRSFMEIDLVTISERWVEREAQLAFRYLLGLCSGPSIIEKDSQDRTRLERALRESERHGKEISDELKKNVFSALEELGEGFLAYMRSKPVELEAWRKQRTPSLSTEGSLKSDELLTDIYHESLSLMYRLLFLFYAEGRDLLPMEDETYRDSYSLESIRDDIIATHDDPDPKSFFSPGAFGLWERLKELFDAVDGGWQNIIPAYNGGLFDPEQHPFLETFKINDQHLARAIDLLSRTRPGAVRGEGRKKVTYRDLDIRHLGSIYEGILEYHAEIADQEKVIVKRGAGGKAAEEYLAPSELTTDEKKHLKTYRQAVKEDEESPSLPRGCKVTGLVEPGEYYLIYGGRESKRKSSGSYYTPDYIVQYIVENTLGPLVRGENRSASEDGGVQPLTSAQILELKVLDPAMGSGHFLVAATEYLARTYATACIREGKDKERVMNEEDFVHYKRIIAERCIYGVDINPMAVELAKLSMWLFTMDKGRPLSFLNHHLKSGNALFGAWIKDLGSPPDDKRRDMRTRNLFELRFREAVPMMVNDVLGIVSKETLEIADVRAKKALDHAVDQRRQPFRNIADVWVGLHFGEQRADYNNLLLNVEEARHLGSAKAKEHNSFHWELEFPEVFFDAYGRQLSRPGFDAVIGNPPYGAFFPFEDRPVLKKFRPSATDKELESYWLFMHLAAFEVSSTIGVCSLVVPITWLSVPTVKSLRRRILTERGLDRITLMPKNAFHEAGVETVVYVALPLPTEKIKIFRDWKSDQHTEIATSECLKNDDGKIIYWLDERELSLMQKIQNTSRKLGDYAYVTSGYEAYVVGKGIDKNGKPFSKASIGDKIYHSTHHKPGYGRDLSGGDIGRYTLQWNGSRWVKYGTWLSVPRNKAVFTKPRVLIQEITGDGGTVKATFTEEEFYFSRDVLCALDPKPGVSLLTVLAILNSKLFYFYHNSRSAKSQKALFPKVLVGDIKDTPLPESMFSSNTGGPVIRELEMLVRRRLEGSHNNREVEERIDFSVFELFQLTASEVNIINRFYESQMKESGE